MPQAQIRAFIGRAEGARELLPERPFPDGGTTMLFPRLERAAMNQASFKDLGDAGQIIFPQALRGGQ